MPTNITAADHGGSVPVTSVSCPSDKEFAKAADVRVVAAALLAECADIRTGTGGLNKCVLKAGDTMTGRLIVGSTAATNHNAIQATGDGGGAGATLTGGSTGDGAIIAAGGGNNNGASCTGAGSGAGVSGVGGSSGKGGSFLAGGGNVAGASAGGSGSGAGIACTGGTTGPGLTAVNGTAQTNTAPTCAAQFAGYIQLTGTDPNATVDPGANNVLHAKMIPKAAVLIDSSYAVLDSYNVASVTNIAPNEYRVTFVRAMANVNYGIKFNVHGAPAYHGAHNGTKATTHFNFNIFKTDTLALGFGAATEAYIEVTGAQ